LLRNYEIPVCKVSGSKTEFKIMKTKFLLRIAICLSDLVSKSSIKTIMSMKNGISTTFISSVR